MLDNAFFESLDYSLISGGKVEIMMALNKKESFYQLDFSYQGYVNQTCDRCGDDFELPMSFKFDTLLKHGPEAMEDENLWVVGQDCVNLDLHHYLYESLCLFLPTKVTHKKESDCNQELLKKLEDLSNNTENKNNTDPRWDALNKLNKN
jgi:uncharacterized metal-binding protein YceD (DUF177 family)